MILGELIDIGHGHTIELIWYEGVPVGVQINHRDKNGHPCACSAFWAFRKNPLWRAVSIEPLTLEPSILCLFTDCGDHGYIRDGKWVPA